jgi:hypothetical protein
MRVQQYLRIGCAAALGFALLATSDVYSQRGKGHKAAGHKAASAPKHASHGPAMTRPAAGPKAGPRPAAPKIGGGHKDIGRAPGAGPNVKHAAGAGHGRFERPTAHRPGDAKTGLPKIGGDAKHHPKLPAHAGRPGGGASSAQLHDFLGGGPGRDRQGIGKGDRPGFDKKDRPGFDKKDRPIIDKKDDRPIIDKKDRPIIDKKDDRPIIDKKGDRPIIDKKDRPDINIDGDVNIGGKTINYVDNRKAWVDNRHAVGNQVRLNAGNRYAAAYTSGLYRRGVVGGYPYYGRWAGRGAYFGWSAATWASLGTFLGAAAVAGEPTYYAYGNGGNVYYEDNTVYVNGQASGTPEQYAQQALAYVAAAPPPEKATDAEWLPLGTFAVTREDVHDSQGMIELAINTQGVVAGTYYNEATEASRPLKGTLDQKSQRVAIGFADGKNDDVALETGVYNLTQEEAPALLHFGTTQTTPILLVRLQPPQ